MSFSRDRKEIKNAGDGSNNHLHLFLSRYEMEENHVKTNSLVH